MMVKQGSVVIALNGTTSGALEMRSGASQLGITVPTIDNGALYVQGSGDGVTFSRVQIPNVSDGTSVELSLDSGTGAVTWNIGAFPFRWLKIEGASQTAARTFTINYLE